MNGLPSKTIVFVTGAFVSNICWEEWKVYFESNGYKTFAPPWPYKNASPEVLRSRQPDGDVASIGLSQLTEYYADFIRRMPEKPIIIGHSIGGLVVQLLLQQNLAVAGVAIHPVAPQGVITFKWSFYRSTWGPLGLLTSQRKTYLMSLTAWRYIFTNGMSLEEQKASYEKYVIPESKKVSRDGLTNAAHIDFAKPHPPLLITSGSTDHIIPASLNYSNYKKYRSKQSVTDYKEFRGRTHFVLGQPTWKEDAGFILNWLQQLRPYEE